MHICALSAASPTVRSVSCSFTIFFSVGSIFKILHIKIVLCCRRGQGVGEVGQQLSHALKWKSSCDIYVCSLSNQRCFLKKKKKFWMPEDCNHTRTIFQLSYETDVSLLHIEETEISWLPHRLAWVSMLLPVNGCEKCCRNAQFDLGKGQWSITSLEWYLARRL